MAPGPHQPPASESVLPRPVTPADGCDPGPPDHESADPCFNPSEVSAQAERPSRSGDRVIGHDSSVSSASVVPPSSAPEGGSAAIPEGPGAGSNGMEHFERLRRRLLLSTALATALVVPATWLVFDLSTATSLLVGSLAGLLYLVLLARSVARLGGERRSISKFQLLVPVVLVLASARIPQLSLVPALVGFLLYKPALLIQASLDR